MLDVENLSPHPKDTPSPLWASPVPHFAVQTGWWCDRALCPQVLSSLCNLFSTGTETQGN